MQHKYLKQSDTSMSLTYLLFTTYLVKKTILAWWQKLSNVDPGQDLHAWTLGDARLDVRPWMKKSGSRFPFPVMFFIFTYAQIAVKKIYVNLVSPEVNFKTYHYYIEGFLTPTPPKNISDLSNLQIVDKP